MPKKNTAFEARLNRNIDMDLLNFSTAFPDEASCKAQWKAMRDKQGVKCPHCGNRSHYWKSDKECYECKQCKYRQGLRAGTVMHGSRLPFRYRFVAFHLLT
jgi:DNA-directed RNA polymerase subunit RPC12/RpoP